jgi:MFS family permease
MKNFKAETANHSKRLNPKVTRKTIKAVPANASAAREPAKGFSLQRTFTALKYPNYRLWFWGQMASLVGTWMQTTAQGFLIFELTRSPVMLGIVGFASGIPFWVFNFLGGVITDRVPRRKMLLITQTAMMLLAFTLGLLIFTGAVQPWHIILLAFGTGIANAFEAPARMAFMPELVDEREDYANAIALNSTFVNLAVVIGPAVAGLVYAWVGPGWCFTINGISFIAVIVALLLMKLKPFIPHPSSGSMLVQLKEGISYVIKNPLIRALMLMVVSTSTVGHAYMTLLPAWVVTILSGDSALNGLMQSARGLGALVAALMIASLGRIKFKGKLLTIGSFVFPLMVLIWAAVRSIPVSLFFIALSGWGFMLMLNMANTLIQVSVPDHLRGRVMGIYTFAFFGMMPVGALLGGALAQWTNEPLAVTIGASISLIFALFVFLFFPRVRAME